MGYERRLCPNPLHLEKTPSYVIYPTGGYCFGCGHAGPRVEIGEEVVRKPSYVENIDESLAYIASLPTRPIRGFSLPYDDVFYYLVWPSGRYYKARKIDSDGGGDKYRSATGHKKPLFEARLGRPRGPLVIVEGEFNALAIAAVIEPEIDVTIVSPGSAGEMGTKYLASYAPYRYIYIVADKDKAGVKAGIELATKLRSQTPFVVVDFWEKDANDIFTGPDGPQTLKTRLLEMSLRMPGNTQGAVPSFGGPSPQSSTPSEGW